MYIFVFVFCFVHFFFFQETATRVGLLLTIMAPLCIIAYASWLLYAFLTQPLVVTTTLESTFFTTPSVVLSCVCPVAGMVCVRSNTFQTDNALSSFCKGAVGSQGIQIFFAFLFFFVAHSQSKDGSFVGTNATRICYAPRSTERTVVEVPLGCNLTQTLQSRNGNSFDFSNPQAVVDSVQVNFLGQPGFVAEWWFSRLREVHREGQTYPPFKGNYSCKPSSPFCLTGISCSKAPVNVTVWWAEERRILPTTEPCTTGPGCSFIALSGDAVFSVFVFAYVASVATLIAEIGGAISIIVSTFYSIAFVCKKVLEGFLCLWPLLLLTRSKIE